MKIRFLLLPFYFCLFTCLSFAQTLAPGAPGKDAQWASAGKQGVGTSASLESKVWFTLENGAMTEVYYPDVTTANVHKLEFIVVNPKTKKVETETEDAIHQLITEDEYFGGTKLNSNQIVGLRQAGINILNPKTKIDLLPNNSLQFIQQNTAKSGKWKIKKRYITDVENNTILIRVFFETTDKNLELYVYYDPSIGNSGMHDTAWNQDEVLMAQDKDKSSALLIGEGRNSEKVGDISNSFYQTSDGLEQLRRDGKLSTPSQIAEDGNVIQMARIVSSDKKSAVFTLALGFGNTAQSAFDAANLSIKKGFDNSYSQFVRGWNDYVKTLPKVEAKYQSQFNMAAMQLKAHEDKTKRGANIASLTVPWGGGDNANENTVGGYHLVWSRDLYQVATAYMALGDTAAANRALDFVFNVQQKPDGSFPQNSKLDGTPFWGSLQLDEVAFPLILSYQLKRFDKATWENHVKKAADFIVKTGPKTPQERWEEKSGYSPSTIAAEIAGLVCAAEIARVNNDETSANLYLKTADDWQANIEKWTATTNGKYGDGNYYIRLTENGTPDAKEKTVLNNNAGNYVENEIVDAGFLELVRLGIKSPDDPLIVKSLKVIDEQIKVNTPNGEAFYRYNHDGYGEMDDGRRWNFDGKYTGKGRLWALLSGERGQYEIALANSKFQIPNSKNSKSNLESGIWNLELSKAKTRLDAMLGFANDGLMIPEQVWDKADVPKNIDKQFIPELKFGEGTGSATPLAWSMAQFIRLAVNLQAGKNLDTPDVVYNRYVLKVTANKNQQSSAAETSVQKPQRKTGLSLEYALRPKNKEFENFSINWDCDEKWGTNNTSFEKTASRIMKGSCIEFFQCNPGKTTAIVFYEGAEQNVEIVGDFTEWKPKQLKLLDFASETKKLKFLPLEFSSTARVEYKLIVDGKWVNDPLNPNKVDNGVGGENSFFTMPDYKPTSWDGEVVKKTDSFVPTAFLPPNEIEIKSQVFNETRKVKVYNPIEPGTKNVPNLPVLYLQDGTDYINRAKAINIQYNLVKAGKLKPFIMVFVDYKDRMKEYWASDDYAKFLAEEVVPAIDKQYKTIKNRDGRAILGASLGGVTSVHAAIKYPEIFGRVGGQSSSFWIDNERVIKELETLDAGKSKFKFYFDVGTLEGADDDRKAVEILRRKGYDVTYEERETGHNWTSWRDRLADAFVALWADAKK